ncbi:MAG TPA: PIN domain-containing protein [Burkholderiales bacterium]|nr:PIN domain-containing protein [Betaproteobacteria bacterium]HQR52231.1 PIN domain-containing protein [Burkholderiales bacterium]
MSVFVDTNVLLYRFDSSAPNKQSLARAELRRLVMERSIVISTQVLQEFFVVATRRLEPPLNPDQAGEVIRYLSRLPLVQVTPRTILEAIALHRRFSLSFWDALIVRSAIEAGADTLYTEDLQEGQVIEGVTVVNPFAIAVCGDSPGSR